MATVQEIYDAACASAEANMSPPRSSHDQAITHLLLAQLIVSIDALTAAVLAP